MMAETPKSSIRRCLKDVGTPRTPTVLNASFARTAKQKLLVQGCEILLELLKVDDDEVENSGNCGLVVSLGKVQDDNFFLINYFARKKITINDK